MSPNDELFCTDIAWQHSVPLVGTATRGDTWFLLEYPGRWEAKALEGSSIPAAVKTQIASLDPQGRTLRTLLIRQPHCEHRAGMRFFAAQVDPLEPRLYEYPLGRYEDLLDIDLASPAAGGTGDPAYSRIAPLYLACTNGRRDPSAPAPHSGLCLGSDRNPPTGPRSRLAG